MRVQTKLQEDFNGDKDARDICLVNTSNLLMVLAENTGHMALNLMNISDVVDKQINAEHGPGRHTSQQSMDN